MHSDVQMQTQMRWQAIADCVPTWAVQSTVWKFKQANITAVRRAQAQGTAIVHATDIQK